jgi:hypothetical protein
VRGAQFVQSVTAIKPRDAAKSGFKIAHELELISRAGGRKFLFSAMLEHPLVCGLL